MNKKNSQIILVVGLGNPGKEYEHTRHNVGFVTLDWLAEKLDWEHFKEQKKFRAMISENKWGDKKIIAAKPLTFMNNSGETVAAIKKFYQVADEKIIIVYDELDLPFGKIRIRAEGSSAGHNGLKSIIEKLGSDKFWRVRIGIGNERAEKMEAADFVLSKLTREEKNILNKEILPEVIKETEKIIKS